jgi:2-methylisocitrate lyase-like PEP mutase family enzyme
METNLTTAKQLRDKLHGSSMVVAPFVYDALQAKIAERVGFEAVYMTGFGTAAARGFPDLGLLTMSEMVENVRSIARSVKIPLIRPMCGAPCRSMSTRARPHCISRIKCGRSDAVFSPASR